MRPSVRALLAILLTAVMSVGLTTGLAAPVAAAPPADFAKTGCEHLSDSVYRLYQAAFGRTPDVEGFDYWLNLYQTGEFPLRSQAGYFLESPEFEGLYGSAPTDEDFVDNLYLNVLGRPGERDGRSYWLDRLADGLPRSELLLAFTDSDENVARTETVVPMLGSFNQGLDGPWSCEQPSCSVGLDDSINSTSIAFSAISVQNTKAITIHVETRVVGGDPVAEEYPLGPARSGERMGATRSPVEAASCAVVGVTYDPAPYVAPAGVCTILPPTGSAAYDVGVDFVTQASGEATLSVAVRDGEGHRLATGYHLFFGSPVGTRITERTGSYPPSTRSASSCEILSIAYSG